MFLNNPINFDVLENFLRNSTFLTLFFTMFFYWVNMAISYPEGPKGRRRLSRALKGPSGFRPFGAFRPIKRDASSPLGSVAVPLRGRRNLFHLGPPFRGNETFLSERPFGHEEQQGSSNHISCESPTGLVAADFPGSAKPISRRLPLSGTQSRTEGAPEGNILQDIFAIAFQPFGQYIAFAPKGQRRDAYRFLNPRTCMVVSNILLVLLLLVRWEKSGHFPLSNLYESLMFLSWCCTFLYLINPFQPSGYMLPSLAKKDTSNKQSTLDNIFGSIIAPSALLMNAFATFSLPKEMQQATPLVPALQSNWLMMHVTVMIISYASLIIGSLLSILFLILNKLNTSQYMPINFNILLQYITSLPLGPGGQDKVLPSCPKGQSEAGRRAEDKKGQLKAAEGGGQIKDKYKNSPFLTLDFLSYRIIGLGFPFLTIGILSGAVWANEAWGSYWSWDPKETWALLTWLVFAIYLHTRLTKGWQGEKPAIIASVGFFVVWFCYLGVNLIGEGLHTYGFFKSGYNN